MSDVESDEPVRTETLWQNSIEWRRPSDNALHRIGAPAIEWNDGIKVWFQNGVMHREDGPAYEDPKGNHQYHLLGEEVTFEQFKEQRQKLAEEREQRRQETMRQLMEACEDATVLKNPVNVGKPLSLQRRPSASI